MMQEKFWEVSMIVSYVYVYFLTSFLKIHILLTACWAQTLQKVRLNYFLVYWFLLHLMNSFHI